MSNSQVGMVYAKIIDDVINICRAPFEEEGAQPNVLQDFKKAWQQRLSERKVAQMLWDPQPAPVSQVPTPAAQAPRPPQYVPPPPSTATAQSNGPVKVKTEPSSYDLQNLSSAPQLSYPSVNSHLAYQNASRHLQEQFGDKANASIQQINERAQDAPQVGQKRPLPASSPTQQAFDSKKVRMDYDSDIRAQTQQKLQQLSSAQQRPAPLSSAQADGAADWKAIIAERRALAAAGTEAADLSIVRRVEQLHRAEEGGGLMLSASEQAKHSTLLELKDAQVRSDAGIARYDGPEDDEIRVKAEDDEEDDADAINSDLDDSDDEDIIEDEDEDAKAGELMVCTYEKVARVKNKWKCTLKDGILITGGKEYVFAKATGEFEW